MNKFYKICILLSILSMYDRYTNRYFLSPQLRRTTETPFYASKYLYSVDYINFYKNHSNTSSIIFS